MSDQPAPPALAWVTTLACVNPVLLPPTVVK